MVISPAPPAALISGGGGVCFISTEVINLLFTNLASLSLQHTHPTLCTTNRYLAVGKGSLPPIAGVLLDAAVLEALAEHVVVPVHLLCADQKAYAGNKGEGQGEGLQGMVKLSGCSKGQWVGLVRQAACSR